MLGDELKEVMKAYDERGTKQEQGSEDCALLMGCSVILVARAPSSRFM